MRGHWFVVGPRGSYAASSADVTAALPYGLHLKTYGAVVTACGRSTMSWVPYWGAEPGSAEVCERCRSVSRERPHPSPSGPRRTASPEQVARHLGLPVRSVALALRGGLRSAPLLRERILRAAEGQGDAAGA
jgi:hypothetical protein